jgi:hypothetical protein
MVIAGYRHETGSVGPIDVNLLFQVRGLDPFPIQTFDYPVPVDVRNDIRLCYLHDFGPGMDALLDTTWYSKYGYQHLSQNEEQLRLVATFLHYARFVESEVIGRTHEEASEDGGRTRALETKLIWSLLTAIRRVPGIQTTGHGAGSYIDDPIVADERREREETIAHLSVLEAILTGTVLSSNPAISIPQDDAAPTARRDQLNFWRNAAAAVSLNDDSPQLAEAIYSAIVSLLGLINNLENRHSIYAMLYLRLMQDRVAGFPDHMVPSRVYDPTQNAVDALQQNINYIAEGSGCTSTMRRIMHMYRRSWYCR